MWEPRSAFEATKPCLISKWIPSEFLQVWPVSLIHCHLSTRNLPLNNVFGWKVCTQNPESKAQVFLINSVVSDLSWWSETILSQPDTAQCCIGAVVLRCGDQCAKHKLFCMLENGLFQWQDTVTMCISFATKGNKLALIKAWYERRIDVWLPVKWPLCFVLFCGNGFRITVRIEHEAALTTGSQSRTSAWTQLLKNIYVFGLRRFSVRKFAFSTCMMINFWTNMVSLSVGWTWSWVLAELLWWSVLYCLYCPSLIPCHTQPYNTPHRTPHRRSSSEYVWT